MADLFISYARKDRSLAESLASQLDAQGFSTWWDASLSAGANFSREIQSQIDQSQAVLVIWTENSVCSDWVLAEVQRAYSREKLICIKNNALAVHNIPLPYNMLHCIGIEQTDDLLESLQKRSINPSFPEKSWSYYRESSEIKQRVMQKFCRIAKSYESNESSSKDPALDVCIEHDTTYEYDREVSIKDHTLRLHPTLQFINFREYNLHFLEPPDVNETASDLFDNVIRRIAYLKKVQKFGFKVSMIVNLTPFNPYSYYPDESFFNYPFAYRDFDRQFLRPYLELETDRSSFEEFASSITPQVRTHSDYTAELLDYVKGEIRNQYDPSRVTGSIREISEILSSGKGTSGELSVVMVNLLRYYGLAARYVSGYLIDFPDFQLRHGVDAEWEVYYSAWVQTYVPGGGWIGLDPMTGLFTQENYVPLACGLRLEDTSILVGRTEIAQASLKYKSRASPTSRSLCFS